ncbi:DMT family transporter [Geobacter sp. FeAm09]|uniref:DMT family transporter n=1 Tax=Geobacter sp. FeAm09 TaxID=2597769 RepID=UPI0011EDA861|nr:DMT family transporter [Geobacter sp. FeAm09]QEM68910.1 DMT family transporter [Geobacter sp. FeAm09]
MTSRPQPAMGWVYFILILTTFFWGGSFLFTKIGLREIPPQLFVLMRFGLATLIMLFVSGRRLANLNRQILWRGAVVGTTLGLTNISFVFGVQGTSISRAGILNNLFVLFIPFIVKIVWGERIGRINLAGTILASAGIWLLATGGSAGFNRGDLISTFCALMIACQVVTVSKLLRDDDVYLVSLVQFATAALMAGCVTLLLPLPPVTLHRSALLSVAYCAVFPTVFCFTLQNAYQRYVTATRAGLIYTLDPVWSLVAGFFVLGERLSAREWLGCGIIFVAVVIPLGVRYLMERRLVKRYVATGNGVSGLT